ncbi:angiotensin-converting enzyme-like protein Ace3 [Halyomorpha halys]|uniref:angiotensin-converting enzyme-like protein Ace3 n=1 Tax=Halyomorpha halys TaxID=286706 RepID=UPI0034D302E7
MSKELKQLNREAALRTWSSLVGEEYPSSYSLDEVRIEWRWKKCLDAIGFFGAPPVVRRAAYLLCRGPFLAPVESRMVTSLLGLLSSMYKEVKLCRSTNCFRIEPDMENLMKTSRDPDFLLFLWQGWRDAIGPPTRHIYESLIKIQNDIASKSNYKDMGECWREELEVPWLQETVERLMEQVAPLHRLLHAYVRWALRAYYGPQFVSELGPIPAHLLGNMWSQSWESIIDIVLNSTKFDLHERLRSRYQNVTAMVKEAERFYVSLGLKPMTGKFWKNSIISNENEKVMCHGTAANMYEKDDYRMLVCANITWDDFYVIHHEMGHIEYFMAYENLPTIFQDGANSAFQETIGDTIMLAVETPSHLNRLGIFNESAEDFEFPLLLYQALKKIPQIPFGLVIDKWRWGVMASNITSVDYNTVWWKYRETYEGIKPPFPRGSYSFDPIAKFHVADNTPYIRYFLSDFLQFQFLNILCNAKYNEIGSEKTPLHLCDLFGFKEGGNKLRKMMAQGSIKTWYELLAEFSDGRYKKLSAEPMLSYFSPLMSWLQQQITKYNIPIGW